MNDPNRVQTSIDIEAVADDVWFALVDPLAIARYRDGARVESDWRAGSPIAWRGRNGERSGTVVDAAPGALLKYAFGDRQVRIMLDSDGARTRVEVVEHGFADENELPDARREWAEVLERLKRMLEQRVDPPPAAARVG